MILIDAIYINNGGGKVLLDYLMTTLEDTDLCVFYLLDKRIEGDIISVKNTNKVLFMDSSLSKRWHFYRKHKTSFDKIFVLGNIPPLVKTSAKVYTYFHNAIYVSTPVDFSRIEKIKYHLKRAIIQCTSRNTDHWLVQSSTLKEQFVKKFSQEKKVRILPFFPEYHQRNFIEKQKNTFLYVSNAQANKNHIRLIKAFCRMYDKLSTGKLILTVSDNFPKIVEEIQKAQQKGYPIENKGFMDKNQLIEEYQKSEYIIFPSLSESFGLGIVEGISLGCKVLGADLPYTFAVCNPSLVFTPQDIESISTAMEKAVSTELPNSYAKVKNQIEDLVALLS